MAKEKKPTKDPNKKQHAKHSKRVGHKLYEKTFKHANGLTYTRRVKKGNRDHNENPRDWGKMPKNLRELSKTIRKFDGSKVTLDADNQAIRELKQIFQTADLTE
jgi:hypothetical protein